MSKFCGACGGQMDDDARICGQCGTPFDEPKMSKFCGVCGAQADDDARICGQCGTPLDGAPAPVDVSLKSIPGVGDKAVKAKNPKQTNKLLGMILSGIVLIVVLIVSVSIVSSFTGYKGTVRKLFNALEKYNMNTLSDLASDIVYDFNYEAFGIEEADLQEYFSKAVSDTLDRFEADAGNKIKIKYSIDDSIRLSGRKLDQFLNTLEENLDYNTSGIKRVVALDITLTVKGSKTTKTYYMRSGELYLIKESGSWKVYYPQFNVIRY